jgi:hypothetical protein
MSTRTDKVMTRSETAKQAKHASDTVFITESHARDGCTEKGWNATYHNWKSGCGDWSLFDDPLSIDDEWRQVMMDENPCRCCIAQLFRKEGRENPCNVACRICFNWKGELPGTKEFY